MKTAIDFRLVNWIIDFYNTVSNKAHDVVALGNCALFKCKYFTLMTNYHNTKLNTVISLNNFSNLYRLKFLLPTLKVALVY